MKVKTKNPKSRGLLKQVGLWATIWWGVSGLYVVLVVWLAKDYYAAKTSGSELHNWAQAIGQAYSEKDILTWLGIIIVLVWLIGGLVWLKALRRARISYCAGLKDLLFTIR